MVDEQIRYGEILKVDYSVSSNTDDIESILDVTENSSIVSSSFYNNMEEIQQFT